MRTTISTGPKKTVDDPWIHPARSIGFIVTALLTIVLTLTGATLPWLENLPRILRIGTPIFSGFLVGGAGWWLTGNRLKLLPRFFTVGTAAVIIAGFGWMIAQALKFNEVLSLTSVLTIAVILVLLFLSITGWIHLAILYPKIRRLWSIPAITSLLAAALASPRFIWGQEPNLEGTSESAVLPVWLHTATVLYVLIAVIAIGLFVGGFAGWLAYFGVTTGSFYERTAIYLLLSITTLLLVLLALLGLLENINTIVSA